MAILKLKKGDDEFIYSHGENGSKLLIPTSYNKDIKPVQIDKEKIDIVKQKLSNKYPELSIEVIDELEEMSGSDGAGGYLSKYAFSRKKLSEIDDEEIVKTLSNQLKGIKEKPKTVKPNTVTTIKEGYRQFRKQVTTRTPGSTSQAMVRSVKRKLKEIENILHYSNRLSEEMGKPNINPETIKEISNKLKELTIKVKQLNKLLKQHNLYITF
jgi:hypothetical protein